MCGHLWLSFTTAGGHRISQGMWERQAVHICIIVRSVVSDQRFGLGGGEGS